MATTLPYAYSHLIRYFTKGVDAQGPYYRVEYSIDAWSNADDFVNALLGKASVAGGPGGTITRTSPHQHPLSPNLFCTSAEVVEGVGAPVLNASGYPNYSGGAIVRAEYRALTFTADLNNSFDPATPITWATQELDFAEEVYTVQNSGYRWQAGPDNGNPIGVPAKISIPLTTMVLTYERIPYMPMTLCRNLRGRVNSTTFLGSAAGMVHFKGGRTKRDFNTDGSITQMVQFVFLERDAAYPWNSLPSRNTLAWYPVADSAGNKLFRTADLNPLVVL